jgi:YqaJ-like viral recombinase domain
VLTKKQRDLRRKYIGASDVPRIMAGDSVRLVHEKLAGLERDDEHDLEQSELFEARQGMEYVDELAAKQEIIIGHKAEAAILDEYGRRFRPIRIERSPETIINPDYPWLAVHPDQLSYYEAVKFHDRMVNTEAKSVGSYRRRLFGAGGDELPHAIIWQAQTQMLCLGTDVGETHVPVCFLNETTLRQLYAGSETLNITIFVVQASFTLQQHILRKTEEVAGYIARRELPPPQSLDDTLLLYPKSTGARADATLEVAQYCQALKEVREQIKQLGKDEARLKFHIQEFMQQASELYYADRLICTWRNDADGMRLDKDLLKATRPDIYEEFSTPHDGARKLLIKIK